MSKINYIFKYILITIGAVILTNGVILAITTNMNLGNYLQLIIGILFTAYGIFYRQIKEKFPKWIKILYWTVTAIYIFGSVFLIGFGLFDSVDYKEDAVIILGAGLRGNQPGTTLKSRLDTALEYQSKNPDVIFVLSGGQGSDERISEAEAMATYLIGRGINPSRIIIEDKSTSTRENFEFSSVKLHEFFGEKEYSAAYITNEFHIYRAGVYAHQAGLGKLSHLHADSRIGGLFSACLRECLAVAKLWVGGN